MTFSVSMASAKAGCANAAAQIIAKALLRIACQFRVYDL
jgi:hypothetical protein